MSRRLQYKSYVSGIPANQVLERITVDKWIPNTEVPQSNWAKGAAFSAAVLLSQISWAPQPIQNTTVYSQQSSPVVFQTTTQYQQLTQPVGFTALFTLPPLTWNRPTNQPVQDIKRTQYTYNFIRNDVTVSFNQLVSVDKFAPIRPDKIFDLARTQYLHQHLFETLNINTASTFDSFNNVITRPWVVQYQSNSFAFTAINTVDKWVPRTEVPPKDVVRNQYLYPFFSIDTKALTGKEPSTPDRWGGNAPAKIFDVARTQYSYPHFSFDVTPAQDVEEITPDRWIGQKPDYIFDLKRLQYMYPPYTVDAKQFTQIERTTPDKWIGAKPDYIFDVARRQYTYPHFSFDLNQAQEPEEVTPDRWMGNKPDFIFDVKRLQFSYPNTFFLNLSTIETVTVDKWVPETQRPPKDVVRNQFLFPSLFIDSKALTNHENCFPDKWVGQYPSFIFDLKRTQYTYQFFTADTAELVIADNEETEKYQFSYPRALENRNYAYPSFFASFLVLPQNQLILSSSDPILNRPSRVHAYPSLALSILILPQPNLAVSNGEQVLKQKNFVYLYPSISQSPLVASTVSYAQLINDSYPRGNRPTNYANDSVFFPPIVPKVLSSDWYGYYPITIDRLAQLQYMFPMFMPMKFSYAIIPGVLPKPKPGKTVAQLPTPGNRRKGQPF